MKMGTHKNELERIKSLLEAKSSDLEKEIKEEFSVVKTEAGKKIRNALLITGGSIAAIVLLKLILSDKKKTQENRKSSNGKRESIISSHFKSILVTVLLGFAKRKLVEYLNEKTNDSKSDK